MTTRGRALLTMTALVGAVLATAVAAPAMDLRSWDQKLTGGTRFVLLAAFDDLAVLDKETGLVWQRMPSQFDVVWGSARNNCGEAGTAGRQGWRLPEAHELMSLVGGSGLTVKLPTGHKFVDVQAVSYWTATSYYPETARVVNMFTGAASSALKDQTGVHFWCVRGRGGE